MTYLLIHWKVIETEEFIRETETMKGIVQIFKSQV